MKFWFVVAIFIPAIHQGIGSYVKIYNAKFDEIFVDVIFLKDFQGYLKSEFNKTQKCYKEIKDEYRKLIIKFKKNTEEVPYNIRFLHHDKGYYQVANKALNELNLFGVLMESYEKRLREKIEQSKRKEAFLEIKETKEHAEVIFDDYLYYKQIFMGKPPTVCGVFDDFYYGFNQVKLAMNFKKIYDDFIKCIVTRHNNNF